MVKRDEQGRLVIVEMVDGVETVVKVIPKHEEQLYLRRQGNNDFIVKAEADRVEDMERPYDPHIFMAGGEVRRYDKLERELPDHPECREPETLREPLVVDAEDLAAQQGGDEAEYTLMGVNLDPGENPEDEPVEEQK